VPLKIFFCRYKYPQRIPGEAQSRLGYNTGLPVELQGGKNRWALPKKTSAKKISVAEYNEACRKDVMKFTDVWNNLTERMGYWVNLNDSLHYLRNQIHREPLVGAETTL